MAAGGDGEHTRFPFLATVRYMVATVVTVLTVVVVVMVITVALRPEEIRFSINRGYIWADELWSVTVTRKEIPSNEYAGVTVITPNLGTSRQHYYQVVKTYRAVDNVNLWVSLSAHNPSGRANVNCTITGIRVLDMPNAPLFTGMVEIASRSDFNTSQQDQDSVFSVPRQTSHSLRKLGAIHDKNKLFYIFERYVEKSSFSAFVEVYATVFYKPFLSTKIHNVSQLHYCWPVTVGDDTGDDDAVSCKTSEEIDWTVNSQLPAPAPAPAPAVEVLY